MFPILLKFFCINLRISFSNRSLVVCHQFEGLSIKLILFQEHQFQTSQLIRINPNETKELERQVEEIMSKRYI